MVTMKGSEEHIIRDYREGDEKQIVSLFRSTFGKELTVEDWQWKYSVPGEGRIYSKVVENASHEIIGHAGAIPLTGILNGQHIKFFQIADVMVHHKARGFLGKKNIFSEMIKALFERIGQEFREVFCYGFPGKRPYTIGERVGAYETVEYGIDCLKYVRRSFLARSCHAEPLSWSDERIDTLWKDMAGELGLALVRDRRYLFWRYAEHPVFTYQLFGIFRFGKFLGWAVVKPEQDRISVVDLLCSRDACRKLMRALETFSAASGKKQICIWLPQRWRKLLKGYEFQKTEVVIANMVWRLPLETPFVREKLFYTMGDVDIF